MTIKERSKRMAPESIKTRKAREKLQKQWADREKQITPEALHQAGEQIRRRIARYAHQRVTILKKSFDLFDRNQNTAKVSPRTRTIVQKIEADMEMFNTQQTQGETILDETLHAMSR